MRIGTSLQPTGRLRERLGPADALEADVRFACRYRIDRGLRAGVAIGGEPVPGVHRDVAVFDFQSPYPSLIRAFQLDPLAHALADIDPEAARDPIAAPGGARFAREGAILPGLIERDLAARAAAKARGDRHADQAIESLPNARFGVLGAPACRLFDPAIANAITAFGQQTLRWTAEAFAEAGVRVLYGDTDSVVVAAARAEVEALRTRVPGAVAARIRRAFRVEPQLELETFLDRLWLSRVRGGAAASHERYAGWTDGRLVGVGLESVRRDRPAVARRLQRGLLERLSTDRPLAPVARERWPSRCSPTPSTRSSSSPGASARAAPTATRAPRRPTCRRRASPPPTASRSARWCAA